MEALADAGLAGMDDAIAEICVLGILAYGTGILFLVVALFNSGLDFAGFYIFGCVWVFICVWVDFGSLFLFCSADDWWVINLDLGGALTICRMLAVALIVAVPLLRFWRRSRSKRTKASFTAQGRAEF